MEQTGRQRASRIALDYHKSRDDLWRRRMFAAGAALVLSLAYVAYAHFAPQSYSTGPLSRAHARWDVDCRQCHDDFSAVDVNAWSLTPAAIQNINDKCTKCHSTSEHHGGTIRGHAQSYTTCTACHHEHRGRDVDLKFVEDRSCTSCHEQLDQVRANNSDISFLPPIAENVTAFAKGKHPEFRSLAEDPGNIRFNHQLHLLPGITGPPLRDPPLTLESIAGGQQFRSHANQPNDAPVQLDCADCHSVSPEVAGVDPETSTGRLMQGVRYELHCKACHPLDIGPMQTATHGISLPKIREQLLADAGDPSADSDAHRQIEATVQTLQGKCAECHEEGSFEVEPHKVVPPPRNWLRHAYFRHDAHIGVSCNDCHKAIGPSGIPLLLDDREPKDRDQNRTVIEGVKVCVQCHGSSGSKASIARSNCAECHRFHVDPVDDPLYGKSTRRWRPHLFEQ